MINPLVLSQLDSTSQRLVELLDADVREIFSTMLGVELDPAQPSEAVTKFKECVTAMVGLAGSYNGMISINAPQPLALAMASQMLGMEITECDDDVRDALGEIANMIGGCFKHHFVKDGHEVRLSTPSVMSGDDYVMSVGAVPDTLTLLFPYCSEQFMICLYLEPGE